MPPSSQNISHQDKVEMDVPMKKVINQRFVYMHGRCAKGNNKNQPKLIKSGLVILTLAEKMLLSQQDKNDTHYNYPEENLDF